MDSSAKSLHCRHCAYQIDSIIDDRCPECGNTIGPLDLESKSNLAARKTVKRVALSGFVVALLFGTTTIIFQSIEAKRGDIVAIKKIDDAVRNSRAMLLPSQPEFKSNRVLEYATNTFLEPTVAQPVRLNLAYPLHASDPKRICGLLSEILENEPYYSSYYWIPDLIREFECVSCIGGLIQMVAQASDADHRIEAPYALNGFPQSTISAENKRQLELCLSRPISSKEKQLVRQCIE